MVQKRLLLQTVHDLWQNFVIDYQDKLEILPKFSFFASLRPTECIVAGDPGSHNICVCEQHENVKLKLMAWNVRLTYKDLIEVAVCDVNNIQCTLYGCEKCPGVAKIREVYEEEDHFYGDSITFKWWENRSSREYLETVTQPYEIFKNTLFDLIWDLRIHHFISKEQKRYLQHCKDNLKSNSCILIMDFSENYSFVIQNSVQVFYYNNTQATIYPFTMYYKTEDCDDLKNKNFCIISDTKDHYAYTIHTFIQKMTDVLKNDFEWIKSIIYFSDGAPQQYKNRRVFYLMRHFGSIDLFFFGILQTIFSQNINNAFAHYFRNNLINMCHHKDNFGIEVTSYNFFGTGHGKTENDGHGGTIKRTTSRHSLRAAPNKQITTAKEMYESAVANIESIR